MMKLKQDQFNVLVLIEKYQGSNYSIGKYAEVLHMNKESVQCIIN